MMVISTKKYPSQNQNFTTVRSNAALEQLLKDGDGAFKDRLKEDNVKDFLSAREIKSIRNSFQEYATESEEDQDSVPATKTDSGIHSTYWPQLSDIEVPPLDIGWTDSGFYKGVTRATVHTHPPKDDGPHIKQVVRKLIQESSKVVAVVMDLLTDLQILQDLLDAAGKRFISVYILLDSTGMPHFLDMCSRLQVGVMHLKKLRVRTLRGTGLPLSFGRLPGCLGSKYMLVDGDKVMTGSYSFTWSASRMDRNIITVMTGQVVDFFDRDFREMYALSEGVDLYKEFQIDKPPTATPKPKPKPTPITPKVEPVAPPSTSRFQSSPEDGQQDRCKIPAHKFINPKYSLVVGPGVGRTGSLQGRPLRRGSAFAGGKDSLSITDVHAISEKVDRITPLPSSPTEGEGKEAGKRANGLTLTGKKRTSFRVLLKVNKNSLNADDMAHQPSPKRDSMDVSLTDEEKDRFDKDLPLKPTGKLKSLTKLSKSLSLMSINKQEEDGSKVNKQPPKRGCIQS
ncbi:hypothetical protein AGOR_G00198210 [Albula goreensis]|uniref:Scaffolding anchor of CK1 domain-containing protein n=1 Tax=Albula goreensis TaxID=1534307 RepID=A0A8T3CSV5_9TELE|nr:hypothetical protein AGOR_G00198210 [Albula goreensis]